MKIKATINYRILPTHKDIDYITDYDSLKIYSYSDVYSFDSSVYPSNDIEFFKGYIMKDLALVAGGGYNTDNITDCTFDFVKV